MVLERGRTALALAAVTLACLVGGCGSSSKPAYCSDVASFKQAVNALSHASIPGGIPTALANVQTTGKKALASVKSSFAPQTQAVKHAVSALGGSVKELKSQSTRLTAIGQIPDEVKAVKSTTKQLVTSTKSRCS